jgi:glycine betaine/proline transport system substrate-binding protein
MKYRRGLRRGTALAMVVVLSAGCAAKTTSGADSGGKTVNIALNSWVGYEADAAVVSYLLEHELHYKVKLTQIDEQPAWQALDQGTLDVILENWGHADLVKTYIDQKKTIVDGGPTGNKGVIGWYVPKYVVDQHPDITNWKNLNKYASIFRTPESGSKGQFLGGSPSYVTNDKALIKNLKLNYQIVYAGSEAAEITQVKKLYKQKKPALFYFYTPQWLFNQLQMVKINLPKYTNGCDADPKKVACDYPAYDLNKIFRKGFTKTGGKAYQFLKNFHWTNKDQNDVAGMIANQGMDRDAAAKKWVDSHKSTWQAWLPK